MTSLAYDREYERICRQSMELIPRLTREQLQIVLPLMQELAKNNEAADDFYHPQTEAQLFARIDHALEQVRRGEIVDANAFDTEMEEMLNA